MKQYRVALGKTIKKAMIDADLSLPKTARAAGMSVPTLRRKLAGEGGPLNVLELHGLSRALGVPMADLLPKERAVRQLKSARPTRAAS